MSKYSKKTLLKQLYSLNLPKFIIDLINIIPRENFIDPTKKNQAYINSPLPIECMQTISQPYIVAKMTSLLTQKFKPNKILEIGTGSGYQSAILSLIANEVHTLERFEKLYSIAKKNLLEYSNVNCYYRDGFEGLIEESPFDGVIITASVENAPNKILKQMAKRSILVYPEKTLTYERLVTIYKENNTYAKNYYDDVKFVPMLPELA